MEVVGIYSSISGSLIEIFANSLLPAILLAIIVQVFLFFQTGRNAATHYGVWLGALALVFLLPAIVTFVDIPKLSNGFASSGSQRLHYNPAEPDHSERAPITAPVQFMDAALSVEGVRRNLFPGPESLLSSTQSDQSESYVFRLPADLGSYAFSAWIVGSLFLLIRLGRSYRHMQILKSKGQRLNRGRLNSLLIDPYSNRSRRSIDIAISTEIESPAAVGLFRPLILLPSSFMERFSDEELAQIVFHESAHLRRWDDWTKLFQEIVQAILFFNPVVWWIGHQLDLNREIACDDWVMVETNNDWHSYSACLLKVLEAVRLNHNAPAKASLMMAKSRIESRIKRLVAQKHIPSTAMSFMGVVPLFLIFIAVLLIGNPLLIHLEKAEQENDSVAVEVAEPEILKTLPGVKLVYPSLDEMAYAALIPTTIRVPIHAIETFRFEDGRSTLIGETFEIMIENQNMEFDLDEEYLYIDLKEVDADYALRPGQFSEIGYSNVRTANPNDEIVAGAWIVTNGFSLAEGKITQFAEMGLNISSKYGLRVETVVISNQKGTQTMKAFLTPIMGSGASIKGSGNFSAF